MADRSVAFPLLCLLSFALLQSVTAQGTTNLTLAVFLSGLDGPGDDEFTGDLDGLAFQAAVDLALERANNRSDVLPEYTLGASYQDGQVGIASHKSEPGVFVHNEIVRAVRVP